MFYHILLVFMKNKCTLKHGLSDKHSILGGGDGSETWSGLSDKHGILGGGRWWQWKTELVPGWLANMWGWDVSQLVQHQTGTPLMQVQFHGAARNFSPSQLSVQTLFWSLYSPCVKPRALTPVSVSKVSSTVSKPLFGLMKILHALLGMGSAALSAAVALPR